MSLLPFFQRKFLETPPGKRYILLCMCVLNFTILNGNFYSSHRVKTAALGVQMLWVSEESVSTGVKVLGSLYFCFSESRPILQAQVSQVQPGLWGAVLLLLQKQGTPPPLCPPATPLTYSSHPLTCPGCVLHHRYFAQLCPKKKKPWNFLPFANEDKANVALKLAPVN